MLKKLLGRSPDSDDLVSACRAEDRQKFADLFGRSQMSCICLSPALEQGIDPKMSQEDSLENIQATATDFCKQEQFEPFCYAKGPQRRMPLFTNQSLVREFATAYFRRTKRSVPLQVLGVNGRARCLCLHAVLASVSLLLCLVPTNALAKQTAGREISSHSLPDAPPPKSGPQGSAQQSRSAEGSASVAGTVLDVSGAAVPGADVSLMHGDGSQLHTMMSEANGEFNFTKIPPGSYLVIINAKGFAPFTSSEFDVAEQQTYEVPNVSLSVATANIEVTVRPTDLIATEQIKAEEKQRLIGLLPNFYTSYIHDAAPLTARQKFSLATRGTFDPVALIGVGIAAGMEQATNAYAGYGQGAAGYSKRYAAKFVDGRSSDFLTHAVFPALFHQDPRYYYQGSGSVKSRLVHAVSNAFVTRNDHGRSVLNYSYLLGNMCSGALSNLYYPQANRGANLVFTNAAVGLAGRVGTNLLREFSKRLTTNVPGDGPQ